MLSDTLELITHLKQSNQIDDMTYKFLTEGRKVDCGKLYFLLKVHKLPLNVIENLENNPNRTEISIPGRPIISQYMSPTARISKLLDLFLLPLVKKQDTYIEDTNEFIKKLQVIKCPENVVLCVYDLTSMYTNMYIPELIESVENVLDEINPTYYTVPMINKEN